MLRSIRLVGACLFSAMLLMEPSYASDDPNVKTVTVSELGPVKVGAEFPTFGGHTLSNDYVSLRSLIGQDKTIIVSYFATWCQPCRVGLPKIEKFVQENDNVVAIYIALGEKSSAPVSKLVSELNLKSPILMDKFESIGVRHGVVVEGMETVLPRTFVIKSDGTVKTIFTVEGEDFSTQLLEQLK